MYTLGYRFRPWTGEKAIADGPSILDYVRETARGVRRRGQDPLRLAGGRRVVVERRRDLDGARCADGSTSDAAGSCGAAAATTLRRGLLPATSPGVEDFTTRRRWCTRSTGPRTSTYAGKRVVVIGSGATAVTLVPAMAERAAHVTMLQRSPTYIASLPGVDKIATALREKLPPEPGLRGSPAGRTCSYTTATYQLARRRPELMKSLLRKGVSAPAARGLRRRPALQAVLRPVGPAAVPGAGRRPVPLDPAAATSTW